MKNIYQLLNNFRIEWGQLIKEDKFLIFIPFLTITIRFLIFTFIPHTYEDAFITFRYAENLAKGFGLVYNIGERVYGTTTPLFAIILGFFKIFGVSCVVSSLIINLISEALTSLIIYKILKDFFSGYIVAVASLLFVFSPSNISWSVQGMETAFFSSIIAVSFYYAYKNKYYPALVFGFFSAMIRIDGLSVTLIILIATFIKQRSSAFRIITLPFLLFIIWELFLYFYFGSFLPNSMIAKLVLYSGHQDSVLPNLSLIFSKYFEVGYYSSSIITILFLMGVIFIFIKKNNLYSLVAWFFAYHLALVISKTSIHGWYLIPPLFAFIIISDLAILYLFNFLLVQFRINKKILHIVVTSGILIFSALTLYLKVIQMNDQYLYEQTVRIRVGKFLNENSPQNSSVFLEPIGIIGYYSSRYIFDDVALVSPIFLKLNKLPNTAATRFKKIQLVKPDYLVLRDRYLSEFYSTTDLIKQYEPIKKFEFTRVPEDPEYPNLTIFRKRI